MIENTITPSQYVWGKKTIESEILNTKLTAGMALVQIANGPETNRDAYFDAAVTLAGLLKQWEELLEDYVSRFRPMVDISGFKNPIKKD